MEVSIYPVKAVLLVRGPFSGRWHDPNRLRRRLSRAWRVLYVLVLALTAHIVEASVLHVPEDYPRVTDAIAAASFGDTVRVGAGVYSTSSTGDVFPLVLSTNGVSFLGAGAGSSILDAQGQASVLVLQAAGLRVSGFTITGGMADQGGGIRVDSGDPAIDHVILLENRAKLAGAAIYVAPGAAPWIHHNVAWRSMDSDPAAYGDPHGIQIVSANGLVEHNLLGRGDSNGLITTGTAKPVVRNNIFFENGTPGVRGRGFCALSDSTETITNNVFFGNAISAMLVLTPGGPVDVSAAQANDYSLTDHIASNLDGDPVLVDPDHGNWHLSPGSLAIDAGDPGAGLDPDGTAPDAGPFYFDQHGVGVQKQLNLHAELLPSLPNPFRVSAYLSFILPRAAYVRLEIVDLRGRRIATLVDGVCEAGKQGVVWNGRDLSGNAVPNGVYVALLSSDGAKRTTKLLIVR